jgi:hypothetical protein
MDQRDQDLLDKQVQKISPTSRHDGVLMLAVIGVFIAGILLGGSLYSNTDTPMRIAANDTAAVVPHGPPPIAR